MSERLSLRDALKDKATHSMTDDALNLVLNFKLAGDSDWQIRPASRIRIDGRGSLKFYPAESTQAEMIDLARVRSLSIHAVGAAGQPA